MMSGYKTKYPPTDSNCNQILVTPPMISFFSLYLEFLFAQNEDQVTTSTLSAQLRGTDH